MPTCIKKGIKKTLKITKFPVMGTSWIWKMIRMCKK